jgi:hypothetical protein
VNRSINHYTLNTGHCRASARSEVGDDVVKTMTGWLDKPEFNLPFEGYLVRTTTSQSGGLIATVWQGKVPLFTFGVADSEAAEEELWPSLEKMYHSITDLPVHRSMDWESSKRPDLPWVAVVLVAPVGIPAWAGDFERCLAWAWIERKK